MSPLKLALVWCVERLGLWFVQEIDGFVQEFLSVVSRLPSCIWTLQTLAQHPVPSDLERLQEFCCVNQARFQQLRRYSSTHRSPILQELPHTKPG